MCFRPDIGFPRVDPGATHLERDAVEAVRFEPGAATEPIPRLQNQHVFAVPAQFPRGCQAGEATPNDERVVILPCLVPFTRSHTCYSPSHYLAVSERIRDRSRASTFATAD